MSNAEQTTGAEYLLWVPEEERRIIQLVAIYLQLLVLNARRQGKDELCVQVRDVHQQFPHFVEKLDLNRSLHLSTAQEELCLRRGELCPAVMRYDKATSSDQEGRRIAFLFYLFRPPAEN